MPPRLKNDAANRRSASQPLPAPALSSSDDDDDDGDDDDDKAIPECLEESCFIQGGNDEVGTMTATQLTKEDNSKMAIREVLVKDKKLLQRVLFYTPLDFEDFHARVRGSGIVCNKQLTMTWLDEMGIQFSMKNTKEGERRKEKTVKRQQRLKAKKAGVKP